MKQLLQWFCFTVCTGALLHSCDNGYLEFEKECYFQNDIQFLQALINKSQSNKNSPSSDLNPVKLGWQIWENGRLVELCSSPSTNTECKMDYVLSGSIPKEIGNLTQLRKLSLESNNYIGLIPKEIGELKNITHLTLSKNQLSGNIPSEIGKLESLEHLGLNSNKLYGNLPP